MRCTMRRDFVDWLWRTVRRGRVIFENENGLDKEAETVLVDSDMLINAGS
jgi:hypothetical protein